MTNPSTPPRLSQSAHDFVDEAKLFALLDRTADSGRFREILAKSVAKEPLTVEETAELIAATDPEQVEQIFETARQLKRDVYGNRIVIFAPLYIGNECVNDCAYCAFRCSNKEAVRISLGEAAIREQVLSLEASGHKRLILVFGEHPKYDAQFIADTVRQVASVKKDHGEIRRVNINAAPLDHEGYKIVKEAGIGTYQVFQETYHHGTYAAVHPAKTRKGDYLWRLDALARAMEAGCDDVGIGALFGLYDWRFEVLGLIEHSNHLFKHYNVGPHTISFPRLQPAHGVQLDETKFVSDYDFKRLVAILRLAVPYTGMILTARESQEIRREVLNFGVSQIDAGTRIELGGYTKKTTDQELDREQFQIGDVRTLDEVMLDLLQSGYIPSFCTACYRLGRTGEHFMEFAIPGFIHEKCTPNALTTLDEYLVDYASPEVQAAGRELIEKELAQIDDGPMKQELLKRLRRIEETDDRDLYF
ncbi:MAG: [FeFe] hydrogenase H-cluster radical SAM maturase HydG [Planctomycetia bacterium]